MESQDNEGLVEVAKRGNRNGGQHGDCICARKDGQRVSKCNWRQFWAKKKRFTITTLHDGGVKIQELAFNRTYNILLDSRELQWVIKIMRLALDYSDQWIQRVFSGFREMCGYRFVVLLIGCRTLRIS
ncbi:hypothetical protein Scep_007881 [Stephania cephalantha]|uniref:Uncharacterized protein n=1 Tax=Stephania cephalantha TaxID=152367 RepID=A0AAP0PNN2_9MAGN